MNSENANTVGATRINPARMAANIPNSKRTEGIEQVRLRQRGGFNLRGQSPFSRVQSALYYGRIRLGTAKIVTIRRLSFASGPKYLHSHSLVNNQLLVPKLCFTSMWPSMSGMKSILKINSPFNHLIQIRNRTGKLGVVT